MEKIDLTYMKSLAGDDNELIKELIDIFKMQVPEFIDEMNQHYNNKDWESLSQIAHKAKSSLDVMGLSETQSKLKELELMAKEGTNVEQYKEIIDLFEATCRQAIIDADEVLENM